MHNFLQCHASKCVGEGTNFPLRIIAISAMPEADRNGENSDHNSGSGEDEGAFLDAAALVTHKQALNEAFIAKQLPKIHWPALLSALSDVGVEHDLPAEKPESPFDLPDALSSELHRCLMEVRPIDSI